MGRSSLKFLLAGCLNLIFIGLVYGSDGINSEKLQNPTQKTVNNQYSINHDMAFISIHGSRPDSKKLQGFQRAILFNARGEVVRKIDMKSDSIFSLDRMIQENKSKGPLIIKMYR